MCRSGRRSPPQKEALAAADFDFDRGAAAEQVCRVPRVGELVPGSLTPDSVTPSGLVVEGVAETDSGVEIFQYSSGLEIDLDMVATELGTFLHRCFEVLGVNPVLMDKLLAVTGVELEKKNSEMIVSGVGSFEAWLRDYFDPLSVARELPILALDNQGSVVSGIVDLVVRTGEGVWIIDHKSDRIEDPEAAFNRYRPQLDAYVHALSGAGENELGIGINWIRFGVVVLSRIETHI